MACRGAGLTGRCDKRLYAGKVHRDPGRTDGICIVFYGINIDNEVAIGPGLYLPHGKVCVAGVTVVGQNVTRAPWTTVGPDQATCSAR